MKSIVIDEEGFPLVNELRLKDETQGQFLLNNIERHPDGYFQISGAQIGASGYVNLEAFDAPIVVRHIEAKGENIFGTLPYGIVIPVGIKSLWVDEWDRFRGTTTKGIPFVFSRPAQMEFFELLEEFDDDSLTWNDEEIPVRSKADLLSLVSKKPVMPISEHSSIVDMLPRLKLPKSRILCLLAPGEFDVAPYFAKDGHIVQTKRIDEKNLVRAGNTEQFDFVYVSRDVLRPYSYRLKEFFKIAKSFLGLHGTLFVVADLGAFHEQGNILVPELTEWEVRESLRKEFDFLFWGRWDKSPMPWQLRELFIYGQIKRTT